MRQNIIILAKSTLRLKTTNRLSTRKYRNLIIGTTHDSRVKPAIYVHFICFTRKSMNYYLLSDLWTLYILWIDLITKVCKTRYQDYLTWTLNNHTSVTILTTDNSLATDLIIMYRLLIVTGFRFICRFLQIFTDAWLTLNPKHAYPSSMIWHNLDICIESKTKYHTNTLPQHDWIQTVTCLRICKLNITILPTKLRQHIPTYIPHIILIFKYSIRLTVLVSYWLTITEKIFQSYTW